MLITLLADVRGEREGWREGSKHKLCNQGENSRWGGRGNNCLCTLTNVRMTDIPSPQANRHAKIKLATRVLFSQGFSWSYAEQAK